MQKRVGMVVVFRDAIPRPSTAVTPAEPVAQGAAAGSVGVKVLDLGPRQRSWGGAKRHRPLTPTA